MLQNSDVKKTIKRGELKYQITSKEKLARIIRDQDNQELEGKTEAYKAEYFGINKKTYDSIIKRGTQERKRKYYLIETNLLTSLKKDYISNKIKIGMLEERIKELLETKELKESIEQNNEIIQQNNQIIKLERDQRDKKKK